jgi:hypothetical protein
LTLYALLHPGDSLTQTMPLVVSGVDCKPEPPAAGGGFGSATGGGGGAVGVGLVAVVGAGSVYDVVDVVGLGGLQSGFVDSGTHTHMPWAFRALPDGHAEGLHTRRPMLRVNDGYNTVPFRALAGTVQCHVTVADRRRGKIRPAHTRRQMQCWGTCSSCRPCPSRRCRPILACTGQGYPETFRRTGRHPPC